MSPITTHVLDTANGKPAQALVITLEKMNGDSWETLNSASTNADGRVTDLMKEGDLETATYRMSFETGDYFKNQQVETFYPVVRIVFEIGATDEHYHVPLLLSPFGYSTYRGS